MAGQFKYLAEQFGKATGPEEERRWAHHLVNFVMGGPRLEEGGMSESEIDTLVEDLLTVSNQKAESGCDRCSCGCKYWENDRCIDCRNPYDASQLQKENDEC